MRIEPIQGTLSGPGNGGDPLSAWANAYIYAGSVHSAPSDASADQSAPKGPSAAAPDPGAGAGNASSGNLLNLPTAALQQQSLGSLNLLPPNTLYLRLMQEAAKQAPPQD